MGQHAYVGLGGYLMFSLVLFAGMNPLYTIPLAGLAGAVIAVPVAWLVFRLKGPYFAIGTWVVAEVFRLLAAQMSSVGGGAGLSIPVAVMRDLGRKPEREMMIYLTAFALCVGAIVLVYLLLRSRMGLALTAIRDNEIASRPLGVRIGRIKLFLYVAAGAVTTMIGALIFVTKLRISPDAAFSVNDWTVFVIFIVVIGGIGTIEGPIIGTLSYFVLREFLADLGAIYLMILGAMAIGIMLAAPKGLWGLIVQRYDFSDFPCGLPGAALVQFSNRLNRSCPVMPPAFSGHFRSSDFDGFENALTRKIHKAAVFCSGGRFPGSRAFHAHPD